MKFTIFMQKNKVTSCLVVITLSAIRPTMKSTNEKEKKKCKPYANIGRAWTPFNVEIFKETETREIKKREEFHTPMNLTEKNK